MSDVQVIMSNKFKIILGIAYLLILTMFLYLLLFSNIEINRLNDFSYYKELQINISNFIGDNLYKFNLFFFFHIFWITFRVWISLINYIRNIFWQMGWDLRFLLFQ